MNKTIPLAEAKKNYRLLLEMLKKSMTDLPSLKMASMKQF